MKILTVVGARPQFIKAGPVSKVLKQQGHDEYLIHTGQHYDYGMSDIFFEELGLSKPYMNLEIGSGNHGQQTGKMLIAIEEVIIDRNPDWVLIYGDTNSTLAGALAASKLHVPIAHVESGLRSFNRKMPEEINRIVADKLSDLLFAPTQLAATHLLNEGILSENIHVVGDVMYDAAIQYGCQADEKSQILDQLSISPNSYILVTLHRAENTDHIEKLKVLVESINSISSQHTVVFPIHPRTQLALKKANLLNQLTGKIKILNPVGYLDMISLEKNAMSIVTDSGGVQKEAFFYSKPCVTLRDETEWSELIDLGWNHLCPVRNHEQIVNVVLSSIGSSGIESKPYGNGNTSNLIVDHMSMHLTKNKNV